MIFMDKKDNLRCFVSLNFSKEVINKLENIQKKIINDKLFTGKLTESSNLHLTLKFLGEIDSDKINKTKKILNKIKFNQINANFSDAGVFSKENIRIIWIKLNGVDGLQKEIDNKLKGLFPKEKRFM